jgi:hypothetical protein
LAQAFLINNEAKSAQVCLNEGAKLWEEVSKDMSAQEKTDCEKICNLVSKKTEMERKNTNVIGNINDYAFLKSEVKESAKKLVKPEINPKYDWYQN